MNSELTNQSVAHAAESVRLAPATSEELLYATDLQAEPAENPLESEGVETSTSSASPTLKERADAMDNTVEPSAENPSDNTEPSSDLEKDEPVLRLPLTLSSGGGR